MAIPQTFDEAFARVKQLVSTFSDNESKYLAPSYSEAQARLDFIDKFWIALGWIESYNSLIRCSKPSRNSRPRGRRATRPSMKASAPRSTARSIPWSMNSTTSRPKRSPSLRGARLELRTYKAARDVLEEREIALEWMERVLANPAL